MEMPKIIKKLTAVMLLCALTFAGVSAEIPMLRDYEILKSFSNEFSKTDIIGKCIEDMNIKITKINMRDPEINLKKIIVRDEVPVYGHYIRYDCVKSLSCGVNIINEEIENFNKNVKKSKKDKSEILRSEILMLYRNIMANLPGIYGFVNTLDEIMFGRIVHN